jgi:hypothetical protein
MAALIRRRALSSTWKMRRFSALRKNSTGPAFLGRFPEDHKFGLGRRYALLLEQQVAQVLVSPPAT